MQTRLRQCLVLLPALLLALLLQTAAASAHASLTATEPGDGSTLAAAPASYSLTFSEPVSPLSLTLVKPDGSSVPLGSFQLHDRTVVIEAPLNLPQGTHVLSWRVVSEDGHPVGGSVVFSIGTASATAPMAGNGIDWAVRFGLWLAKVALYAGLFVGVGGVFALRVLMPGIDGGAGAIKATLLLGACGAIVSVAFQGLDALGAPMARIVEPIVWRTGLGTSHGRTVLAAIAAFGLAGWAMAAGRRLARLAAATALVLVGLALASSGHAAAAAPQWLMRPMVFLHAIAIAVWVGALAPLRLTLGLRGSQATGALARFSRIIPPIVGMLVLAGIVLAIVQVRRPEALLDTAYGQVFALKIMLVVALFLLAAVNRWSLTGAVASGDQSSTRRLIRSIATETAIVVLILAVAAAWRFTPPPRVLQAAAAETVMAMFQTGKVMAHVQIAHGRFGPNAAIVELFDLDHRPIEAKDVTLVFANPEAGIEPFRRTLERQAEGKWSGGRFKLPITGNWRVRVDALISDFEIVRLEGQVRIKP